MAKKKDTKYEVKCDCGWWSEAKEVTLDKRGTVESAVMPRFCSNCSRPDTWLFTKWREKK